MDGSRVVETSPAWLAEMERNSRATTLRTIVHTADKDWEKLAVVDFPRRRVISGLASSGAIVHGDVAFAPMGCELSLPPILYRHEMGKGSVASLMSRSFRIGETISLMKTRLGLYVEAAIDETPGGNYAWDLMRRKRAKGLSIGATKLEISSIVNGIQFVSNWSLSEMSVCPAGAPVPLRSSISSMTISGLFGHERYRERYSFLNRRFFARVSFLRLPAPENRGIEMTGRDARFSVS
jgi:hypothetical protein